MRLAHRAHLAMSFQCGPPNFVTFNLGFISTYSIDLVCLAFVVNGGKCQHNWRTSIVWLWHSGHGIEWNGTEISVWNMEDARMEWNGRFQEWNGRQSSILPYQFHTRCRALYLQKNTY